MAEELISPKLMAEARSVRLNTGREPTKAKSPTIAPSSNVWRTVPSSKSGLRAQFPTVAQNRTDERYDDSMKPG
jgi:hypothetical protein